METLPKALLIALFVQLSSQGAKVVILSLKARRLLWRELFTPGGMPSAHSALVTALSTAVAVFSGPGSDAFAIAAVFSVIVIYDAIKIRGQVQDHAQLLKRLQERVLPEGERATLHELAGHSVPEVLAGIAYGLVVALPIALLLR